jgi:hypothetical protein
MIIKILSANDIGKTKAHQAGILIPKQTDILSFFPALNSKLKNPRAEITFTDESLEKWKFNYIYYNNKLFGGTRNEFRLTCMTKFLKSKNLKVSDKVIFSKQDGQYMVSFERKESQINRDYIKLGNNWITVNIK